MVSFSVTSVVAALLAASTVAAQSGVWQQCGGNGWSGPTTCVSGTGCVKLNDWYYQCQPGAAAPSSSSTSVIRPTSTTSTRIISTSTTAGSGTTSTPPPVTGSGPGSTLLNGFYWIRAVAPPNYHLYLQGETPRAVSNAVLKSGTTAGQFNIINGQLVQLISSTTNPASYLYAHVTRRVGSEQTLLLTWETTPDTYGTFTWSGDTLQWSTPGIQRQNNAAWLVCGSQRVYVNLGPYAYQTPAGCADQTIHYYNGATADL